MRRAVLVLLAVLAVGACTSQTVQLPSDPRWVASGACRGVGTDMVIHGSATDPRVTWATSIDGQVRVEITWPVGYAARFVPDLEVLDETGKVIAREGDHLTGVCGGFNTPSQQPVWVSGGQVAPEPSST